MGVVDGLGGMAGLGDIGCLAVDVVDGLDGPGILLVDARQRRLRHEAEILCVQTDGDGDGVLLSLLDFDRLSAAGSWWCLGDGSEVVDVWVCVVAVGRPSSRGRRLERVDGRVEGVVA